MKNKREIKKHIPYNAIELICGIIFLSIGLWSFDWRYIFIIIGSIFLLTTIIEWIIKIKNIKRGG